MLKTFHVKSIIRMSNVETNYHGKTEITINAQEHTLQQMLVKNTLQTEG